MTRIGSYYESGVAFRAAERRKRQEPAASGTHRIAVRAWDAPESAPPEIREVGTLWRAGVWAVHATCSTRYVAHLPTGLCLASLMHWRVAEYAIRRLGALRSSWGEDLGWADREGLRRASEADPLPGQIAAWCEWRDSRWERDHADHGWIWDVIQRGIALEEGREESWEIPRAHLPDHLRVEAVLIRLRSGEDPQRSADEIRQALYP